MTILTTRQFDKQYVKLRPSVKLRFKARIEIFREDPRHRDLRNHALVGRYKGYRSIDITGDVRAFYTKRDDETVILSFIGSHAQLYG